MIPTKKTKIVCTIGPKTESEEALIKLLKAGMNVMRLNFSHGDFDEHSRRIKNLKLASEKTGVEAAILQVLAGPKIRIGKFKADTVVLKKDSEFVITTDETEGDENRVSVNYPNFSKEISKGNTIYLHDGQEKLQVTEVNGNDVICKVLIGGEIRNMQGVNLPDADLSITALTEKDKEDLKFGLENKVDFVALSFVRSPKDILNLREILNNAKSEAKIIAKIETPQAIKNIDEIISEADGIMVARGDLGIEVSPEQVPALQKMIIKKCNEVGKPVITATQMMESMIESPVPTRAEVSDVANAIIDGTDAVMLSEETALGEYPEETVLEMARVALCVEEEIAKKELTQNVPDEEIPERGELVTSSVAKIANKINAKYIVCLTRSGNSARLVSRFKPYQPIIVFTPNEVTFRQLLLSFGTYPVLVDEFENQEDALKMVKQFLHDKKLADHGDKIVVVSGSPFKENAHNNMMLVESI
ncbi:MAG: pyruvate kinase [bacterium]